MITVETQNQQSQPLLPRETSAPRAPLRGSTLVESLLLQAEEKGQEEHLVLRDNDRVVGTLSFADLRDGALSAARALVARGVEPRQTVALMLPTSTEFYLSFLGVLAAGAVPVPIYPPVRADQLEEYVARHAGILHNAEVRALVTFREAEALARMLGPRIPTLKDVVRADRLVEEGRTASAPSVPVRPEPEDLGLIQYTSGSTGDPKGVTLTHANLLSNVEAIGEAMQVNEDDVVVSWLPLYHDMGLIGCWFFALCHGLKMISFSPLQFLRRPRRWLQALTEYSGSLSPAPNFAYELCLRRIPDRDLEGLDLSSWRGALNGAEPINPETLERFCERFGPYGFRPEALKPVYGLAENTVALTFPALEDPPRFDLIQREPFERERRAQPVSEDGGPSEGPEPLRFVSVGRPLGGQNVRVVDDNGVPVPERLEGQIEFKGTSTTPGYYKNTEATAAMRTSDGWTKSGDLGYVADGDLFITGRVKDLIIKGGRNIYPQEVELVAAEVEGVRRGCVVAFSAPDPTGLKERLVVIAETRRRKPEELSHLAAEVKRHVNQALHVSPDEVVMVPPQTVLKTPSGKLRRLECRKRHLDGTLTGKRPPAWIQVARLQVSAWWHKLRRAFGT